MKNLLRRRLLGFALGFTLITCHIAWSQIPSMLTGQQASPVETRRGSATQGVPSLQTVPEDLGRVPLHAGDILQVIVYGAPDLSGLYTLDARGYLPFPLVGEVNLGGKNSSEAQSSLADVLRSKGIILAPSVSVSVQAYVPTYITVMGEVQNPGRYQLLACHPLAEILGLAGGQTALSSGNVTILKVNERANIVPAPEAIQRNPDVCPDEQVNIVKSDLVYVLGAVNRPGGYIMQDKGELNVSQALALAMGTTLPAAVRHIRVIRKEQNGTIAELPVDYKELMSGHAAPLSLRANDVVYVPISKGKAILAGGLAQILGATASAAIYVAH